MAVTATPIFAQTPFASSLSMTAQTACSTRAPTATASLAGANIIEFVTTSTNGLRIDSIQVNACGASMTTANAANIVGIWLWDGTTARLINEILVTAVTPSASATAAFTTTCCPTPMHTSEPGGEVWGAAASRGRVSRPVCRRLGAP